MMDSTLACVAEWMPRQRWYAAKGRAPSLRLVTSWDLDSDDEDVRVRTLLVSDEGSVPPVTYQVPIVVRATTSVPDGQGHIIGSPEPGTTLIDGAYDPAFADALLSLVTEGGQARGPRTAVTGRLAASAPRTRAPMTATVLSGEQSNTSLIYRTDGEPPVICKLFRQVQAGFNPDIELQIALADAGSPYVPPAVGWVDGEWPDGVTDTGAQSGSLAFAQEFLAGVQDAWRVALASAAADDDFTGRARDLGTATAEVHASLAALFATRTPTAADRASILRSWRGRLDTAIAEVPGLDEHREAIDAAYETAVAADWAPLQRVHGDYHLGQVILVPDRGWVLLDFEGEPLRPMAERVKPDIALRDVAGMLRSFDYVAGSIELDQPARSPAAVRAWAQSARGAFLSGYEDASGAPAAGVLLNALELDKAVYETTYEARNRPTWVPIPLRAIERLVTRIRG